MLKFEKAQGDELWVHVGYKVRKQWRVNVVWGPLNHQLFSLKVYWNLAIELFLSILLSKFCPWEWKHLSDPDPTMAVGKDITCLVPQVHSWKNFVSG